MQVDLLQSFANDILDFARLEEGYFELDQEEFSFHKVMHDIYLMFHRHADAEGKNLIYNISKTMPKQIYGDQRRLQQVLINLIKNALKFTS